MIRRGNDTGAGGASTYIGPLILLLKILVSLASTAALVGWAYVVLLAIGLTKEIEPWYGYFLFFPIVHLAYCLISCTRLLRGRWLILSGVLVHLGLGPWVVSVLLKSGNEFFVVAGMAFALMWVLLCLGRTAGERP